MSQRLSTTVGASLRGVEETLKNAGIERPRRDARLLLAHALSVGPEIVLAFPERPVRPDEAQRFAGLVARRLAREPVSRILGQREFWSLPFALSADTLDPRPDSEVLVEAVLARVRDRAEPLRLLDLGTGSGCLLLSLLTELPNAHGYGLDASPGAVETARRNAVALGLGGRAHFAAGRWAEALSGLFDIIVSNPPYIRSDAIDALEPEVAAHDPRIALDGGPDGLDAYRAIAPALHELLEAEGLAALEIGQGQEHAVAQLLYAEGLGAPEVARDLAGRLRCLLVWKRALA